MCVARTGDADPFRFSRLKKTKVSESTHLWSILKSLFGDFSVPEYPKMGDFGFGRPVERERRYGSCVRPEEHL